MADGPKQRKPSKSSPKETVTYGNFIRHTLSEQQKSEISEMDCASEFPLSLLEVLVAEGYKLSFSYDEKNQSSLASLTNRVPGSTLAGYTLVGRGATPLDAWHSLCYRHFYLAGEDWSYFAQQGSDKPDRYG